MRCNKCGIELRPLAHFCRNCGVPVDNSSQAEPPSFRQTVILPKTASPAPLESVPEKAVILPINEAVIEQTEIHDRNLMLSRHSVEADHLSGALKPPAETSRKTGSMDLDAVLPNTEMLKQESDAKPFFTSVLEGQNGNPQHKRLLSIIPFLLIALILIFIFAYIAAK